MISINYKMEVLPSKWIMCVHMCLYVSEVNDCNDTGAWRKELRLFCYYTVLSTCTVYETL